MIETIPLPNWDCAKEPVARGFIKASPQDFEVEEVLGFKLTGVGEHLYLLVEKSDMNTQDLVKYLSSRLMIHPKHISYAGLKDKQAVTRQWISVKTAENVDIRGLKSSKVSVLEAHRHPGKLKRGAHQANRFKIIVRNISSAQNIEQALIRIQQQGVPNYFGEQRFGRAGKNIDKARALFAGKISVDRQLRGLYLSAARSFLFNEVLSERVKQNSWATGMSGEILMLDGSNSFFKTSELDDQLHARLAEFDIHPSAPLWGRGTLCSSQEACELESGILAKHPDLTRGLEAFGLRQQRRSTRLIPINLEYTWLDEVNLELRFQLVKGAYATSVLRELVQLSR